MGSIPIGIYFSVRASEYNTTLPKKSVSSYAIFSYLRNFDPSHLSYRSVCPASHDTLWIHISTLVLHMVISMKQFARMVRNFKIVKNGACDLQGCQCGVSTAKWCYMSTISGDVRYNVWAIPYSMPRGSCWIRFVDNGSTWCFWSLVIRYITLHSTKCSAIHS